MGRLSVSRHSSARRKSAALRRAAHQRTARLEQLEPRTVMTALPFGAMNDDTGEYMLGDVRVTVVFMESNGAIDPNLEDWDAASIAAAKSKVQTGIEWWKQTLDALPGVRDGLLSFSFDWTFANSPVPTGTEPISRPYTAYNLWVPDFLAVTGFGGIDTTTSGILSDIRKFNNFQRQQTNADWAFTVFVVNDANDPDKRFDLSGSITQAFAFAGGHFMVVPASRPEATFAHEAGHMFWAFDEYADSDGVPDEYLKKRGYYNTQNTNAADNPEEGFAQQISIMTDGSLMAAAYDANTSSESSLEMIGWKDSDEDGIFDVLDVPFELNGTGRYNASTGRYLFTGSSAVRTLPNLNSFGLKNDITINRIRQVEYSIDGGPWTVYQTFADRTYKTNLDLSIPLTAGEHTIKIRTVDTRTGVMSPEFVGTTTVPKSTEQAGVNGFVYFDSDGDGTWDQNEAPLADWAVELVDQAGNPIVLQKQLEPDESIDGAVLNTALQGATLTAIGMDIANPFVTAITSELAPSAGRVFWGSSLNAGGGPHETWINSSRQLRISFATPTSVVSLRAIGSGNPPSGYSGGISFGRLEAYDASGNLIARSTTGGLNLGQGELMTIARPTADIAYVLAGGHVGTQVLLDSLSYGPLASVTTSFLGAYSLGNLPTGAYNVKITPPSGHHVTSPVSGQYTVNFAAGQVAADRNFGLSVNSNIWHNFALPANVTGEVSGLVNVLDILAIVNWMTLNAPNSQLPASGDVAAIGYVDVDNNGLCNLLDLLAVVNFITLNAGGGGPSGEGEGAAGDTNGSGGMGGEGLGPEGEGAELLWSVPKTAAEYLAQSPLHFSEIPGLELPCCCSSCLPSPGEEQPVVPGSTAAGNDSLGAAGSLSLLGDDGHAHADDGLDLGKSSSAADPLFGRSPVKRLDRERDDPSQPWAGKFPPRRARIERAIDELAAEVAASLPQVARLLRRDSSARQG
jgi:hypothetical protein